MNISIDQGFSGLMHLFETTADVMSRAIAVAAKGKIAKQASGTINGELVRLFQSAYPEKRFEHTGLASHITEDLYSTKRGHSARGNPRLVDLVNLHVDESLAQKQQAGFVLLPSPLFVAIEAMTIPSEIQTMAYPLVAARILLSSRLNIWPRNSFGGGGIIDPKLENNESNNGSRLRQGTIGRRIVDESHISDEINNCRTLVNKADIWDFKSNLLKTFVGSFLAARGVLLQRIRPSNIDRFVANGIASANWEGPDSAGSSQKLVTSGSEKKWAFRLSKKYSQLPPPSDYINEIFGVPIPIRGADNVFFGGLKPSVNAGLIVQLSGGPGVGKTSFALAMAAALAPLGTATIYLTFEEDPNDLRVKLRQQRQQKARSLSFNPLDDTKWFWPERGERTDFNRIVSETIGPLREKIEPVSPVGGSGSDSAAMAVAPPLPFLVVIDSLSALIMDAKRGSAGSISRSGVDSDGGRLSRSDMDIRSMLEPLLDECRKMNALVLLVTSSEFDGRPDLDYMVDMVIKMGIEGHDSHEKKPLRLFSLTKSRHQISRHGTHVFHLSGDSGFRLAPQLSSQMDALQHIRKLLWDDRAYSNALNVAKNKRGDFYYRKFVDLHSRSQILIQGRGSSGKAGLAMKIAHAPLYSVSQPLRGERGQYRLPDARCNVLVISFLYPEQYYLELRRRILGTMSGEQAAICQLDAKQVSERQDPSGRNLMTVIQLHPGVLAPEDLYSKLTRSLDEGRLRGRPYTSVIIDGLHNLALQFPGAGESSYLFPIIYGTLSRANLSTITTFTSISLQSSRSQGRKIGNHPRASVKLEDGRSLAVAGEATGMDAMEESIFRLRTHLPLLHTLVQASDYVLELWRPVSEDTSVESDDQGNYLLRVQSAVSVDPPRNVVRWMRQKLIFCDP